MKIKFPELSTAAIVSWMVAAFIYAATVFLMNDAIGSRNSRIAELEGKFDEASKKISEFRKAHSEVQRGLGDMVELSTDSVERLNTVKEGIEKLGRMENVKDSAFKVMIALKDSEIADLKADKERLRIALDSANRALGTPRQQVQQPSRIGTVTRNTVDEAERPLPWWRPPLKRTVDANIRASAIEKWKDNYSMVEYEIKQQSEAYEKLLEWNKDYRPAIKQIIAKSVEKWGEKWSMVVYEIEQQTEALGRLNGR